MSLDTAPATSSQGTQISERFARGALFAERYVLPLLYVWFVYSQLHAAYTAYLDYHTITRRMLQPVPPPVFYASITRYILLSVLAAFSGLALIFNRAPTHPPKNLAHI